MRHPVLLTSPPVCLHSNQVPTCYRSQIPLMTKHLEDLQVKICHEIMDESFSMFYLPDQFNYVQFGILW